jgi:hypothetical protein
MGTAASRCLQALWWAGIYLPPDRRLLERILAVCAGREDLRPALFVGVRFYTRRYPRGFPRGSLVTIDPNPAMGRYGSHGHVVGRLEDLGRHFPPSHFRLIIVNGVFGWGIDSQEEAGLALEACHRGLAPGGTLVIGLNEERPLTPNLQSLEAWRLFEAGPFPPVGAARIVVPTPFAERSHTYHFLRRV